MKLWPSSKEDYGVYYGPWEADKIYNDSIIKTDDRCVVADNNNFQMQLYDSAFGDYNFKTIAVYNKGLKRLEYGVICKTESQYEDSYSNCLYQMFRDEVQKFDLTKDFDFFSKFGKYYKGGGV